MENQLYDTIFIEAEDVESLIDAIYIKKEIEKVFKKHDIFYRSYYSGNRGWHFYIDLPLIRIRNFGETIRGFVYDYLDIKDLVDKHVIGNRRGVARIPYTRNEKSGRFSMVLDDFVDYQDVIKKSAVLHTERSPYTEVPLNYHVLPHLSLYDKSGSEYTVSEHEGVVQLLPPCISKIIRKLHNEKYASHEERVLLVSYMRVLGYDREFVKELFKLAADYDPYITNYQVDFIYDKGYNPKSCRAIQQMGLCNLDACRRLKV